MSIPFSLQPILHLLGIFMTTLGVGMVVPMFLAMADGDADWSGYAGASALTTFLGVALAFAQRPASLRLNVRQTYLLTTASWVVLAVCGSLPFMFCRLHLNFTDAFFETVSGLSTTGATVIVGLDEAPRAILLWRALTNWIGGMGIVAMAVAVLPFLRVGGMQLFRTESSDRSDKTFTSARALAASIGIVYVALTVMSTCLFHIAGMNWFDAICHAMAAISTGGFSTKDASLGFYENLWIDWVAVISMFSGAIPLFWYVRVLKRPGEWRDESQIPALFWTLVIMSLMLALWAWREVGMPVVVAATHAATNLVSIATCTGFVTTAYDEWGGFAIAVIFLAYFVGGCTGSTSGSIKIMRWQILTRGLVTQMRKMLNPRAAAVTVYNGRAVDPSIVESVVGYFFAYIVTFGVLSMAMAALGLDFLTAFSSIATGMAGAGPGLGKIVGPAGTFAPLPDAAKWIMCFAMLLGRLELFTIYMLFVPAFWRD